MGFVSRHRFKVAGAYGILDLPFLVNPMGLGTPVTC